ncbi:unnamed protein product [Meloidogyne enterolobii]|uniref:Uncharacterized protein n=1 Tax=Meloidogyne enterolobii TaxID=390850 RepID=A0ACB0XY28_MELEN
MPACRTAAISSSNKLTTRPYLLTLLDLLNRSLECWTKRCCPKSWIKRGCRINCRQCRWIVGWSLIKIRKRRVWIMENRWLLIAS